MNTSIRILATRRSHLIAWEPGISEFVIRREGRKTIIFGIEEGGR